MPRPGGAGCFSDSLPRRGSFECGAFVDRSTVLGVRVANGLRMLRSAPAIDFRAVAAATQTPVRDLAIEVEQLRGRGRCDQFAAAAMMCPLITRAKKVQILGHRVCPPFVTLRSTWDTAIYESDRVPGVARWGCRSVDQPTAPRVAFIADVAARVSGLRAVEQAHCPPAIAVRLAASGPHRAERLAAVTPHLVALAALVTDPDETIRGVAAGRGDLPRALAVANPRTLAER